MLASRKLKFMFENKETGLHESYIQQHDTSDMLEKKRENNIIETSSQGKHEICH